jgi:AAA ATPase domain
MDLDRAEAIITGLITPQYLNPTQVMVFRAAWVGQSYLDLAQSAGYDRSYLKCVGAQVWKMLAAATGCRVSKRNFRQVLESFESSINSGSQHQAPIDLDADIPAFYGRELEYEQLEQWIVTDRCQLVAILGMGGMGKTTIAIELVRALQTRAETTADANRFSHIVWRSLLNAPPLKELLPEMIQTLTLGSAITLGQFQLELMPESVADQIELLLAICHTYRCLIVLDNGESILQAGAQVGQYRDGYADYGDLFTSLAQVDHQSCLLLTSREKPTEISQNEAISPKVRTLVLPGLTAAAGQQIFIDRSCQPISPATWAEIDRYCGGNPLAFQLIAAAVQEVADGDVSEIYPYLQSSTLDLADINMLLEQQWERLTAAEQQVMYWLAICREPMQIIDLEGLLHPDWHYPQPCDYQPNLSVEQPPPPPNSSLLTVLHSLRRRNIIFGSAETEQHQRYWSLRPMVMEYVAGRFVDRILVEIEQQTPFLLNTHPITQSNTKDSPHPAQLRTIFIPAIDKLRASIENSQQVDPN